MDNFELQGEELKMVLQDLKLVNKYLGGNAITINGIKKLIANIPIEKEIVIMDIGCGDGHMLLKCAEYAQKNNRNFRLIGLDANKHTIINAKEKSKLVPNISFVSLDVFSEVFKKCHADIFLCTLTLHHFKEIEIRQFLKTLIPLANVGVVINDLHRNVLAYQLFKVFSTIFFKSKIAKNDGLISILRGFKRADLEEFARPLPIKSQTIHWKWAFRYQWILQK
ncbi:MAG: methyltransferase [Flavobacteriaceae bacterium CG_4_8_14_3_um_filter_34_10]|nr:methyltransferase domain-containing protein [Flavobacteriia bacterium]PIQ17804.1 MAG: methyltransferase [Flavobacteriaceae bacterium CG18_big_fil_WC_8_21_14_2_50_34_36]PIV51483.1 MAG: methyltransferase [Flavobacteriaceae bacterium CG02_land_8_20_14_3_00_34_13]PIX09994.1 MAG: methyltransferase [Flavobacteriaceae bacterium CG_4_8_14_3_um_filter_34_10]PIZ07764.1 MAG: methyltransferase [Flavobacteriaceae bacterium CG_4_10_14_0_8_um_filter_34_31]PJC06494.1 MAG: methyltransferase [Flavobacteriace